MPPPYGGGDITNYTTTTTTTNNNNTTTTTNNNNQSWVSYFFKGNILQLLVAIGIKSNILVIFLKSN